MELEVKAGVSQLIRTKSTESAQAVVTLSRYTAPWQTAKHQSNKKLHTRELKGIKGKCQITLLSSLSVQHVSVTLKEPFRHYSHSVYSQLTQVQACETAYVLLFSQCF